MYEKTIKPILLYCCEIWGFGKLDIMERVQLKFFKSLFGLKKSTPSYMIYGEFGIFPLEIDIYTRMVSFWSKLVTPESNKLSSMMYWILFSYNKLNYVKSNWVCTLKTILIECGLSGIWEQQLVENPKWLKESVRQKLKDLFINSWFKSVNESGSGGNYCLFKESFIRESYLTSVNFCQAKQLLAFRTRNHRLPVETSRWGKNKTVLNADRCKLCNKDRGDEYHTLLCCKTLKTSRKKYIASYYYKHPNVLKYKKLMQTKNPKQLRNLCSFIKDILSI